MSNLPAKKTESLSAVEKVDVALADRPDPSSELLEKLGLVPEEDFQNLGNVTRNTTEMWQRRRKGPPRIRIGNRYYYTVPGALKFIEEKIEKQGFYPISTDTSVKDVSSSLDDSSLRRFAGL